MSARDETRRRTVAAAVEALRALVPATGLQAACFEDALDECLKGTEGRGEEVAGVLLELLRRLRPDDFDGEARPADLDVLRTLAAIRPGLEDQPPPAEGEGPAVWDLVVEDMDRLLAGSPSVRDAVAGMGRSRDLLGIHKYGLRLRARNGRISLRDALLEALDLVAYVRQAYEEARLDGAERGGAKAGPLWYLYGHGLALATMLAGRVYGLPAPRDSWPKLPEPGGPA